MGAKDVVAVIAAILMIGRVNRADEDVKLCVQKAREIYTEAWRDPEAKS